MSYVLPLFKFSVNPAVQAVVQGMLEIHTDCSVADLLLGNCTTGRKVETRVVFGELRHSDTGLTTHRVHQTQSCCSEPIL